MDIRAGRWHYGWAVIGAAAAAFGLGGILGVARALSYDPPAWGYVIISSAAGLAAFILAIKALRNYGSPQAYVNPKVSRLRRAAAAIVGLQALLASLFYFVLVLLVLNPPTLLPFSGPATVENALPVGIGCGLATIAVLGIGGGVVGGLWTGRNWAVPGAVVVEAIWLATVWMVYGTADPAWDRPPHRADSNGGGPVSCLAARLRFGAPASAWDVSRPSRLGMRVFVKDS